MGDLQGHLGPIFVTMRDNLGFFSETLSPLRWFFSFLLRASRCCDTALDFINSRFCSCQVCNSRYFNFKKALGQLGRATPLEFRWHKSGRKPCQFFRQKTIQTEIFSAGEPWYREDLRSSSAEVFGVGHQAGGLGIGS